MSVVTSRAKSTGRVARGAQRLGSSEGVDEEGSTAVHGVAQAVQYLEPWRTFDAPASEGGARGGEQSGCR
jgi:hypothetical protein